MNQLYQRGGGGGGITKSSSYTEMNKINEAGHDNTHTGFYMSSIGLLGNCVVSWEAILTKQNIDTYKGIK